MSVHCRIPLRLCILLVSMVSAVREQFAFNLDDPGPAQLEPRQPSPSLAAGGGAAEPCINCTDNSTAQVRSPSSSAASSSHANRSSSSAGAAVNGSNAAMPSDSKPLKCNMSAWPDLHHNITCGDCKALVEKFTDKYLTCEGYCAAVGRQCTGAWQEKQGSCTVASEMDCDQAYPSNYAICECSDEEAGRTKEPSVVAFEAVFIPNGFLTDSGSGPIVVTSEPVYPPGKDSLFNLGAISEDNTFTISSFSNEQHFLGVGLSPGKTGLHSGFLLHALAAPRFKVHHVQQEPPSRLEVVRLESMNLPGHFVGVEFGGRSVSAENMSTEDMNNIRRFDFRLHPLPRLVSQAWHLTNHMYNISEGPGGDLIRFEERLPHGDKLQGLLRRVGAAEFKGNLSSGTGQKVTLIGLSPPNVPGQVEVQFTPPGPGKASYSTKALSSGSKAKEFKCSSDRLCMETAGWVLITFGCVCILALLFWWRHVAEVCRALALFLWFYSTAMFVLISAIYYSRHSGYVPKSPVVLVNALLLLLILVGLLEVLFSTLVSTNRSRLNGGTSPTASNEECEESVEHPKAGMGMRCESIYSNLSVGMTHACLVFVSQALLFVMYMHAVIVSGESVSSSFAGGDPDDYYDFHQEWPFVLLACTVVQVSLERLLGDQFPQQFANVWSRWLQAKSFQAAGAGSSAGGGARGCCGPAWERLAVACGCSGLLGPDQPRTPSKTGEDAATTSADPGAATAPPTSFLMATFSCGRRPTAPGGTVKEISKLEVILRMCMAFIAQSVERRFILYTLPLMMIATGRDPIMFVKNILAYAYISRLDIATNQHPDLILDPPAPAPETDDPTEVHGQDGEAHAGATGVGPVDETPL